MFKSNKQLVCLLVFIAWGSIVQASQKKALLTTQQRAWVFIQQECARLIAHIEARYNKPKCDIKCLLHPLQQKLEALHYEEVAKLNFLNAIDERMQDSFKSRAYNAYAFNTLHGAVQLKSIEAAEQYLATCSNVRKLDKHGNTPLYYALRNRDEKMVTLLLLYGAEPCVRSKEWQMLEKFVAQVRNKPDTRFSVTLANSLSRSALSSESLPK